MHPESSYNVKLIYFKEGVIKLFRPTQKSIIRGPGTKKVFYYFLDH